MTIVTTAAPGDDPRGPALTRDDLAELLAHVLAAAGAPPPPLLFDAFAREVLDFYSPRAKATQSKVRQVLAIVGGLVGPDGTTADLTPGLVAAFIAARPPATSNNTTLSLLRVLRTLCLYAERRGYLRTSPFRLRNVGDWVQKEKSRRPRQHFSGAEVRRVLNRARSEIERKKFHSQAGPRAVWRARRLHALVATVAWTGLRKMEALRLAVADVDLAHGSLSVVPRGEHRLKTPGSERTVPLAPELRAILADWRPRTRSEWLFPNATYERPWTDGWRGQKPIDKLKSLGRRAGVAGLTFQSLRHSFATLAITQWGLSAEQVARLLGHTTIRTQAHYLHDDLPALRGLAARFDFGGGGDGGRS